MQKFINVSNRLPVTIGKSIEPSSGGLVSALEAVQDAFPFTWVGWPGDTSQYPEPEALESILREKYGYVPVTLSSDTISGFYDGFSNSSLWPMLHYLPSYMTYEERWWEDYQLVNRRFAEKVAEIAGDNDMVWVHDYHLMLLPAELRALKPNLRIGFFLHTPFPSYEVFRCHPRRAELLEGMLGADLLGFHTFGYQRHFQSTVLRILGIESAMTDITYNSRKVNVGVYPVGINADRFKQELASDAHKQRREELRKAYAGKRIVLGVERLDYTKGLARRLQSIDAFLSSCPDKNNIVFVLICVPSRGNVKAYQALRETIESQVGQINGRHATVENIPIHFMYRNVDFTELCALYSIADVNLTTPLRDGMNLVAKEYVACQNEDPGVLILSEFAGAAEELFMALRVNPYNVQEVAQTITTAVSMPREERQSRINSMRNRVLRFDARYWGTHFLNDLAAQKPEAVQTVAFAPHLPDITDRFVHSQRIALFLDYDGTLREIVADPGLAQPTQELTSLFERLARHPSIETFIISGRKPADLEAWMGKYPFTLIAEHGFTYRPASAGGGAEWQQMDPMLDLRWKEPIINVFRHYEGNTPGSWVEEKQSSLVWHFRNTDPEFGMMKAQQLVSELSEMTYNLPVTVRRGKMIVEVCSVYVDKGAAVRRMTRDQPGPAYDLLLIAGDDRTDEHMFHLDDPSAVTIKIGGGSTAARYYLPTPRALRKTLNHLLDALEAAVAMNLAAKS